MEQKPSTQVDFEERLAKENAPKGETPGEGRSFAVEGNDTSKYVGVSPEYKTYANDTEAPLRGEDGAESVFEERQIAAQDKAAEANVGVGHLGYAPVDSPLAERAAEEEKAKAEAEEAEKAKAAKNAPKKVDPPKN